MRFQDPLVEREFQIRYHNRAAKNSQFLALIGLVLYLFQMLWYSNYSVINIFYFAGVAFLWLICEWKAIRVYGQFLGVIGFGAFFGFIDIWMSYNLDIHVKGELTYLTTLYVFVSYALLRLFLIPSMILGVSLSILHFYLLHQRGADPLALDSSLAALLIANVIGVLLSYRLEIKFRNMFMSHSDLRKELKRQQRVLENIMPATVVEKLKNDFNDVTFTNKNTLIIAADLVNFTKYSASVSAEDLLKVLNQTYSTFDELADRYDLMKVKTIGDAIILASGIDGKCQYDRSIEMAIEMRNSAVQLFTDLNTTMSIRIGIGVGQCHSGVLGEMRPKYDVWGAALEQAEEMESLASPGEIRISQDVETKINHKTFLRLQQANATNRRTVA